MKRIVTFLAAAAILVGAYVVASAVYVVTEVEQVIITQFGKPVGDPVTTAKGMSSTNSVNFPGVVE